MEAKEAKEWQKSREIKIENEMKIVKNRQETEVKALNKKFESFKKELELERTKAEAQLVLKHSVITKELKSHNRK